ncbi:MAG: Mth938-like domain-containing protein [Rhodanobacteraceae bacterium]|nr:Mth938-like domain-containing protein [Rhodanobacteraceae bacterium]
MPQGHLYFRRYSHDTVTIVDRVLTRSFLLAPDRLVEDWPVQAVEQLDEAALAAIAALGPELVLLGTGARQVFPAPRVQAQLLQRGIGVEVMDNAAVCRTYNLLAEEGRRVVAAMMLAGAADPR